MEENINCRLLAHDLLAHVIDGINRADVGLNKLEMASRGKLFALLDDAVGGVLRAANYVTRLATACEANDFNVYSPIPLVPPTNTATRPPPPPPPPLAENLN